MADNKQDAESSLSETNVKFLATMMQHTLTKPDVDWDKVAEECGVTVKSAKERYRLLAIKIGAHKPASDSSATTTPKKPTGVSKRKTPGGSARKGKSAKAKVDAEEPVDEKKEAEDAGNTKSDAVDEV